jgi:HlyD family type I secretion membrane fusion protein
MTRQPALVFLLAVRNRVGPLCDRIAAWMLRGEETADTPVHASRKVIRQGLWLAFVLFGIGGIWSALAPLNSAAVAVGQIVVDSNRKIIQHLEGGIIEAILVQEGQTVEAGQVLVRLQETASKSKLESLRHQYIVALATETRLMAERDASEAVDYTQAVAEAGSDAGAIREITENQDRLFKAHRSALQSQASILGKKINEYRHEIEGLSVQEKSQTSELKMLDEEIATVKKLLASGNATKTRLFELQRQSENLRGEHGRNIAASAQAEQAIAETELEIVKLQQQGLSEIVKELKDTQLNIADLKERIRASSDVFDRIAITAPLTGVVTNLSVHTIGGVISPGEKLMEIVPTGDKLIIEARVLPEDIDVVHPGLMAHVRLSAYKSRHVPTVSGKVMTISADRITDERSNTSYYLARIETDVRELANLQQVKLYPGMPADVLIITGSRTLLAYLFNPIMETMNRSFREQ